MKSINRKILADSFDDPEQLLSQLRHNLIITLLWAAAIISLPAIVASVARSILFGWRNVLTFHIVVGIFLWLLVFIRKRLSFNTLAITLITTCFAIGFGGIVSWGLIGNSTLGLIFAGIFTAVFFGHRSALVVTGITLVVAGIIAVIVHYELITYQIDYHTYITSPITWMASLTTIGFYMGLALMVLGRLHNAMEQNIHELSTRSKELHKANIELNQEINERKEIEKSLQISEENFRTIFEFAPDGYYIHDLQGVMLDGNRAVEIMTGYNREELKGTNIITSGLISQEDLDKLTENILLNAQGIAPGTQEYTLNKKNGTKVAIEAHAVPIRLKNQTVVFGIIRDITQKKVAEQQLRESEEKFRAIGSSALDAVILMDDKGLCIYWNHAAETMFGFTADEMMGREIHQLIMPKKYSERYQDGFHHFVGSGTGNAIGKVVELTAVKRDGTEFPIEIALSSFRSRDHFYASAIIRDITERKKAEAEAIRLTNQLQQTTKMEAVGRLAGGIAHDFNNLLTGILGNIALAQMDIAADHPMHKTLEETRRAAESAASLTRQLLAFSRRQIIETKILNLNQLVRDMHAMLLRLIGERIQFMFIPTEPLWNIKADSSQIEQILINLVVNARDAMPEGGRLTLRTHQVNIDFPPQDAKNNLQPGSYVLLEVSDTGSGIDPAIQQRIYEPFFTTKPQGKGTGLGLATIYGAVKQHNGHIDVQSELDKGTTFTIYLPASQEPVAEKKHREQFSDLIGGSESLMFVEDDPIVRNLTMRILNKLGYQVTYASSGEEALQLIAGMKEPIDLLITDVVMPGINGRELADRLLAENPSLKVLFTSGYTEDMIVRHGVREKELNFIGKPYSPQAIAAKIREILD